MSFSELYSDMFRCKAYRRYVLSFIGEGGIKLGIVHPSKSRAEVLRYSSLGGIHTNL